MEGKQLLDRVSAAGVACTYIMINALSFVMKEVTKVSCDEARPAV